MNRQGIPPLPNKARQTLILGSIMLIVPACTNADTLGRVDKRDSQSPPVPIQRCSLGRSDGSRGLVRCGM